MASVQLVSTSALVLKKKIERRKLMIKFKVKIDYKEFLFENSADALSFCLTAKRTSISPDSTVTITLEEIKTVLEDEKDATYLNTETAI